MINKKIFFLILLPVLLLSGAIGLFVPSGVEASAHPPNCSPGTAQSMELIHIGGSEFKATGISTYVRMQRGVYQPNEPISVLGFMVSDDAPRACPGLSVNRVDYGFPSSGCRLQEGQQATKEVGNAPSEPGTYALWWRVSNTWPNYTQERICPMTYTVVSPLPTVSFAASPIAIEYGETSTLTWSSTNATSCSGDGKDGFYTGGDTSGSTGVSPSSETTYTVTCVGSGGTVSKTAVVTVNNPGPTANLFASPASISQGERSTLMWSSENATTCSGSGFSTGNSTSGSRLVSPESTTTYSLTCTSSVGSDSDTARVTVSNTSGGTSPGDGVNGTNTEPQCSDGIDNDGNGLIDLADTVGCDNTFDNNESTPEIQATIAFDVSPRLVRSGNPVTVSWSVSDATSCTVAGSNGDNWTGTSGNEASSEITTETTFVIVCTETDDDTVSEAATVKLVPSFQEVFRSLPQTLASAFGVLFR